MTEHEAGDVARLLSRARTDPAAVAPGDAVSTLTTPGAVDRDGLVGAVAAVVTASPADANRAVTELTTALAHDNPDVRSAAATVVGSVAERRPALLSAVAPALVGCLDDEALLPRINATHALAELAPHAPDSVAEGASTLGSHVHSDFPNLRELAGRCLLETARTEAALIEPAVPDLLALLASDSGEAGGESTEPTAPVAPDASSRMTSAVHEQMAEAQTRRLRLRALAAETITTVAREEPAIVPLDDRLLDATRSDVAVPVRRWGVTAVATLVQTETSDCRPALDHLVQVVGDDGAPLAIRGIAAEALAHYAEARFEETTNAARPVISELATLLTSGDTTARAGSAALLTYLAEQFPDDVDDVKPSLRTGLDAESESVRARTAFVLGFVADDTDRQTLRRLREDDTSEVVREAAEAALRATDQ